MSLVSGENGENKLPSGLQFTRFYVLMQHCENKAETRPLRIGRSVPSPETDCQGLRHAEISEWKRRGLAAQERGGTHAGSRGVIGTEHAHVTPDAPAGWIYVRLG